MLIQLPRLTSSLRDPCDVDQAYLRRKAILHNRRSTSTVNSLPRLELARTIVHQWDEASVEVRQAYKQFVGAVVELVDGEVATDEFQEVALTVYRLFAGPLQEHEDDSGVGEKKLQLQKLMGYPASDANLHKVASLAQRLFKLQPADHGRSSVFERELNAGEDGVEFGADLIFQPPSRFLVDSLLDNDDLLEGPPSSRHDGWHDLDHGYSNSTYHHAVVDRRKLSLEWLSNACDRIVKECASQLSRDELAMAICRVLNSDKPGEEIAGDLLDLVGVSAFEAVQDLMLHRKELVDAIHQGLLMLKSDKTASNTQLRMPSYGTQVTVQTESERQIDKLRRKEEKRYKRGAENRVEDDLSATNFSSLLRASERRSPIEDLFGHGQGPNSLAVTALPQGTLRKHFKGYEEVIIPPTPTAPMKPGEKLIEIQELDGFAQAAFRGYKSLNRIQSQIFQTTYYTNENILVCAPTGAGKTNIAMIAILHEIGQHFRDGYLHKDEFKIVYVAPMKALAAEVTSAFSHRLSPLNMTVRELTGDMQLSKNELEETQMIVTTPEKWDVITRKSSDMSLSMLVKLLIIDEVHLLNDERGAVIEALVARTLRQVFLHILSGASEFDELPVRHNEENYNEALSKNVPYMVDNNRLDDPHVKANLLFQAHFSQLELPISDYVTDLKSVLDQSIRIIQAMIDICANSGWLSSTITCMHLLQMVMQGLWYDKDSSLWMLPCMSSDLVSSLGKKGISSVQQLLDLPKANIQTVLEGFPASRISQDLQHFPRVQVKLKVQKSDTDGGTFSLNIKLAKMNSNRKTSRAFAPRFPKIKDEAWWLVLGNPSNSELYALKRVSLSDRLVTHMELPSTPTNIEGMKLILLSDCYLGFEQEYSIKEL